MIKIVKKSIWIWHVIGYCCDEMKSSIKIGIFYIHKRKGILENFIQQHVKKCPYCGADIEHPEIEW